MRAPAAHNSSKLTGTKASSKLARKISEDDDQSDAETLDTLVEDSPSGDSTSFIATSAAYKKSKKLMLDPVDNDSGNGFDSTESGNDKNLSGGTVKTIKFPQSSKKQQIVSKSKDQKKEPLLGDSKKKESAKLIEEEENSSSKAINASKDDDDDGLYFLE